MATAVFASDNCYWLDSNSLTWATGAWDSVSAFSNVFSSNNVVPSYSLNSVATTVIAGQTKDFKFLAAHTDAEAKVTVNTGTTIGGGFTVYCNDP